jgi:hypothetical protein
MLMRLFRTAFVNSYEAVMALRFFVGVAVAGFQPVYIF